MEEERVNSEVISVTNGARNVLGMDWFVLDCGHSFGLPHDDTNESLVGAGFICRRKHDVEGKADWGELARRIALEAAQASQSE